jgi:hypothetical protein
MPFYTLETGSTGKHLHTPAADRADALRIFGKELGRTLSFDVTDDAETYLMDEWWNNPHWTNPTIPVYAARAPHSSDQVSIKSGKCKTAGNTTGN